MGVIDAFVYAQNHHHRNIENPSNFGDCTKGRVRFMTAITPSYAHLYQLICLTGHIPATLHSKFPLPAAKARYAHLPNARATTRERGNDFQGWAILTGVLARLMAKSLPDGVLSHDLSMEEYTSCLVQFSQPKLILFFFFWCHNTPQQHR